MSWPLCSTDGFNSGGHYSTLCALAHQEQTPPAGSAYSTFGLSLSPPSMSRLPPMQVPRQWVPLRLLQAPVRPVWQVRTRSITGARCRRSLSSKSRTHAPKRVGTRTPSNDWQLCSPLAEPSREMPSRLVGSRGWVIVVIRSFRDRWMAGGTVNCAGGWAPARGRMKRTSSIMCGMSTVTRRRWVDGEPHGTRLRGAEKQRSPESITFGLHILGYCSLLGGGGKEEKYPNQDLDWRG